MTKTHPFPKLVLVLGLLLGLAACSDDDNDDDNGIGPMPDAGEVIALTASNRLVSFNRAAPGTIITNVQVSGLDSGENLLGIDRRPSDGLLHALSSTGRVLTIDPETGVATQRSTLMADSTDTTAPFTALVGTDFGVDFNPTGGVALRIVSNTGQNLRVTNLDTGTTFTDSDLTTAGTVRTGVTAAAYTDSVVGAGSTSLFYLDSSADVLLTTASPNMGQLAVVGALGTDIGPVNGFDIDGGNNRALVASGGATSTLRELDLDSGALGASLGAIGVSEAIRGIAINSTAQARVFAVDQAGNLISFAPATPQTILSTMSISGLMGGETILGIDYRPLNGLLYALSDGGKVYTIDETTATATLVSTLSADLADTTTPFTALAGTNFGVDFNPTGGVALRIVSDTGQNLRVTNLDTGATFTDSDLTIAGIVRTGVTAASYTNSVAGAGSTSLFYLDSTTNVLLTTTSPNMGELTLIGALGADIGTVNGFDIAGLSNSFALVAFQTNAGGVSSLYRINLATGLATLVGPIGATGASPVSGIAIRLR